MPLDRANPPPGALPLLVTQYAITGHPRRSEHWAFVIARSAREGDLHELRGNKDSFTYVVERNARFAAAIAIRGGVHVGWVQPTPAGLKHFIGVLQTEVPVIHCDPLWDSQNWTIEALRALKDAGFVFRNVSESSLRKEMRDERERWECADDVVYERLFADGELCTSPISPTSTTFRH